MADQDSWMIVSVAAKSLGVSIATVRRYITQGWLVARRLPSGHRRVSAASVDRLRKQIIESENGGEGPNAGAGPAQTGGQSRSVPREDDAGGLAEDQ